MPDPFGLKAGSTPPAGMAQYLLSFHAVPKPHPSFQSYHGTWKPDVGLVGVTAFSQKFVDEADCRSARNLYDRVQRQLAQVYGEPEDGEYADPDGTWPDESDFWNALNDNGRFHISSWKRGKANLDAGINQIDLMVSPDADYDTSQVLLIYQFDGYGDTGMAPEYGLDSL
jgi:hypothetical protein